jgi:hypothetical protein
MNGQWTGRYDGSNHGLLVIDLDDMGTHYAGRAYVYDDNVALPSTVAYVRTKDKAACFQAAIPLLPFDPRSRKPGSWAEVAQLFPGVTFPEKADVGLALADNLGEI